MPAAGGARARVAARHSAWPRLSSAAAEWRATAGRVGLEFRSPVRAERAPSRARAQAKSYWPEAARPGLPHRPKPGGEVGKPPPKRSRPLTLTDDRISVPERPPGENYAMRELRGGTF